MASPKTVFIETYGCQMNVSDSELIKAILSKEGYSFVPTEYEADIVMLNTCSVRENANQKVYSRIYEIRSRRKNNPVLVGILGCMATNFKTALLEDAKLKIDFIAGPDSYKQLPHLIQDIGGKGPKPFDVTLSEFETYSDVYPLREGGVNAWVSIMRGCNNFCTFCVVPYTRGRERSRDPHNIVDEIKQIVAQGISQVTLLGQNVNSYRHDDTDFTELMRMVSDVPGVKRIRYTSPHPKDYPRKLLNLMAERHNICKQIHIPLQAGNSRVLDKMNRTYTKEEFLELAEEMKMIMPNISLSTDIIVGFPTETAEEFEETLEVIKKVRFSQAFTFKYSPRKNTLAMKKFADDVPEEEKARRLTALVELQRPISLELNLEQVGHVQTVLIEEEGTKKSEEDFKARNEANTIVILPKGPYTKGDYIQVEITGATSSVLIAKPLYQKTEGVL